MHYCRVAARSARERRRKIGRTCGFTLAAGRRRGHRLRAVITWRGRNLIPRCGDRCPSLRPSSPLEGSQLQRPSASRAAAACRHHPWRGRNRGPGVRARSRKASAERQSLDIQVPAPSSTRIRGLRAVVRSGGPPVHGLQPTSRCLTPNKVERASASRGSPLGLFWDFRPHQPARA